MAVQFVVYRDNEYIKAGHVSSVFGNNEGYYIDRTLGIPPVIHDPAIIKYTDAILSEHQNGEHALADMRRRQRAGIHNKKKSRRRKSKRKRRKRRKSRRRTRRIRITKKKIMQGGNPI